MRHKIYWGATVGAALIIGVAGCADTRHTGAYQTAGPRVEVRRDLPQGEFAEDFAHHTLAYPTGDRETSTVLVEKIVPKQVRVGQRYSYTIRVTNLTDTTLSNVVINETSTHVRVEVRSPEDDDLRQDAGRWVIGTLAPGATKTIEATAMPTEVGRGSSCLGVDYKSPKPTMCTALDVVSPELRITKISPSAAYSCEKPSFTYNVSNVGTGTATDVVIRERLPVGLTTEDGKQDVLIAVGDLSAGETESFTIRLQPTAPGVFDSRAMVRSDADEVLSNTTRLAIVQPELQVTVNGPEWQYVGEPVTYTISVTNLSEVAARSTRLMLDTPMFVAERDRSLGTLAPGQTKTMNVTLTSQGDQIRLRAAAQTMCAPIVADQIVTDVRRVAALAIGTVDTHDPVRVGETTSYEVSVTNQGQGLARNVQIASVIPPGMTLLDIEGPTRGRPDGNRVELGPIDLRPGSTAKWTIEVRADQPGTARFRTEVDSEFLDRPVPDVEPTRIIAPQM